MSNTEPPNLLTRHDAASLLGVPLKTLTWWIWAVDERKRYTRFEIARRSSDRPREIHAPIKPIKEMQRTLAGILSDVYQPRNQVHGFVDGRGPRSNAEHHRRKTWVLRVDLSDFFPSINFGRVRGMFMAPPFEYPAEVATTLAQLCCYENRLPQGAPTSPAISNLICRALDSDLGQIARLERCHFTRYADDITISTDRSVFPSALAFSKGGESVAGPMLVNTVERNGFKVNNAKTNLMRYAQRQRVTGIVVNEKLNVPRDYVRSLRALLYVWARYGPDDAEAAMHRARPRENWPPDKATPDLVSVVRGRVNYVGSIKGWGDPVYIGLANRLKMLDPQFIPKTLPPLPTQASRLFTEGESDGIHILAALAHYHSIGEFSHLHLEWEALPNGKRGDSALLAHCEALARSSQPRACVCLFDRDNPQVLKKALGGGDWRDWGNGVAAVGLGYPSHIPSGKPVCIELLYPPDVLQLKNEDGRRLFLAEEFDSKTGHHRNGEPFTVPHPAKTIVREDVYEFPSHKSVALGKLAFARAIRDGSPPFVQPAVDGFRPTLELLDRAIRGVAVKLRSPS